MSTTWKHIRGSRVLQFLAAVLLCVLGVGTALGGGALYVANDFGLYQGTEYYTESEAFQRELLRTAHTIEAQYDNGYIKQTEVEYSSGESNVQYVLYRYYPTKPMENRYVLLSKTKGNKDDYLLIKSEEFGVLQIGNPGYHNYYYTGDMTLMPEAYNGYRVELYVQKDFPVNDMFRRGVILFNSIKRVKSSLVQTAVGCALGFLLVLWFAFCGAGHKGSGDEITLTWLDRIPFDVVTVILGICAIFGCGATEEVADAMINGSSYIAVALPEILAFMCLSIFVYLWLMTLTARIKSHTLFSNILVVKILAWVFHFLKEWGWPMRVLILAIVFYMFLLTTYVAGYVYFEFGLLLYILWALFAGVFLYCLFSNLILTKAVKEIASGNTDYQIDKKHMRLLVGDFKTQADNIHSIGKGMEIAVAEQTKSERMKTELITNVSHDIKTPLTSIINYTDLLQKEHTKEQEEEYLAVLKKQGERLKKMTEDIVEASRAASGTVQATIETVEIKELISQALAEYEDKFQEKHLTTVMTIPEEGLKAQADGKLLWRVLANLLANVDKYAMEGTRVYVSAVQEGQKARISVKNISKDQLNVDAEELMERFVRGDRSRHTEGSGLGLNIARSLTELMNGTLELSVDGDLFRADVILNINE
ncbi:MAG: HAMP domain-containing histidine kinase [Solobacterium sp.]|nr:HAMP domain-containing histidine kinase [Solobacterium sp.]